MLSFREDLLAATQGIVQGRGSLGRTRFFRFKPGYLGNKIALELYLESRRYGPMDRVA